MKQKGLPRFGVEAGLAPVVIVLLIAVAVGAFFLGKTYNERSNQQDIQTPKTSTENKEIMNVTDSVPKPNAIYLGNYQGQDVLFVTNSELGKYHEEAVEKFSEYKGSWVLSSDIHQVPVDFKELQDPKRILSLSNDVQQLNNFKINDDKKSIYISSNLMTKTSNTYPINITNHIFSVNLDTLEKEELWVHDMSPEKYKNARGATTINQISSDNNYLVLSIYNCFACEGSEVGLIILNNQNKKEKYFEKIGNVQFNLNEKIFTYQKLAPFKEPCDFGPGCDNDNTRTVYKPSGEIFTEALP